MAQRATDNTSESEREKKPPIQECRAHYARMLIIIAFAISEMVGARARTHTTLMRTTRSAF